MHPEYLLFPILCCIGGAWLGYGWGKEAAQGEIDALRSALQTLYTAALDYSRPGRSALIGAIQQARSYVTSDDSSAGGDRG